MTKVQDLSSLVEELRIVSQTRRRKALDIIGAVREAPTMRRTIDGASVLTVTAADHDRKLLNSPVIDERSWAEAAGMNFELVGLSKSGDNLTLTFEDAIVAALRRRTKPLSAPAGTTTRARFVARLAREARVDYAVDPEKRSVVQSPLQRSIGGEKSNSWDVLGADVAEPINWRRFSDGRRLVVGGDDWLMGRKRPLVLREHTDGVQSIDFDLDVAKRASTAKVQCDARLLKITPGDPVRVHGVGAGDGLWLVSEVDQRLTTTRCDVTLTRKTHTLKEPKRQGAGERGDQDYLPGQGGDAAGGTAGNAAREKMVQFALAQAGDAYVWGGNGPSGWDCSGLVQGATAHAGKPLGKPSASQWATCVAQGRTIPIKTALGTRGALLFRIGVGEFNHVAISLGNGSTIEARGTGYGVGVFGNAAGQGWTGAALWL